MKFTTFAGLAAQGPPGSSVTSRCRCGHPVTIVGPDVGHPDDWAGCRCSCHWGAGAVDVVDRALSWALSDVAALGEVLHHYADLPAGLLSPVEREAVLHLRHQLRAALDDLDVNIPVRTWSPGA